MIVLGTFTPPANLVFTLLIETIDSKYGFLKFIVPFGLVWVISMVTYAFLENKLKLKRFGVFSMLLILFSFPIVWWGSTEVVTNLIKNNYSKNYSTSNSNRLIPVKRAPPGRLF